MHTHKHVAYVCVSQNDMHVCVVIVEFRVTNMVGDVSLIRASSVEELRVRAALQIGVLSPCILLSKGSGGTVLEDSDELLQVFGTASVQPHEVYAINNEEAAKQKVTEWTATTWIAALRSHVKFGDDRTTELAEPLKRADEGYEEKMHEWVQHRIDDARYGNNLPVEDVLVAIEVGEVDVNVASNNGSTLLHAAARFGQIDVLNALLRRAEVNVNARSAGGETPLRRAAYHNQVEAAQLLLDADAAPSLADDRGTSPLRQAAGLGHLEVVRILITAGANVDAVRRDDGFTPLHGASWNGHAEVVRSLVRAGANTRTRNADGRTPFDCAKDEAVKRALRDEPDGSSQ